MADTQRIKTNTPRAQTDLDSVKLVAETLLKMKVGKTDMSPLVVTHPFTSSGIVGVHSDKGIEVLDILSSKDALNRWRSTMREGIRTANSVIQIFIMLNKPYYLTFLKYAQPYLSDKDFAVILASAWTGSENPHDDCNVSKKDFLEMFHRAKSELLMDEDEFKVFTELPDTITVFRGVTDFNKKNYKGLAWSRELRVAEWFAGRFGCHGTVYRATIDKQYVLAYFAGRNEAEVVVDPRHLKNVQKYREVSGRNPE